MKWLLVIAFLIVQVAQSQQSVSNLSPHVATGFKEYVYVNFDNPVYITTGKIQALKITAINGTLKKTKGKGKFLFRCDEVGSASIILTGKNYRKEFSFEVRTMRYPEIRLSGPANVDGFVDIRYSDGIYPYHIPRDIESDVKFEIDSFTLEIRNSLDTVTHVIVGASWDDVSRQMIRDAKPKSYFTIDRVYMSRSGRRLQSSSFLLGSIW